uniref:DNA binding protein n=1 Tax=Spodoptera frugiperda nuclear polyhedrosis virus TaxID=10455 RepID=A0A0R5RHW6_NPVSF|nr:DNA binding protein [Spodoptera frugiperda multiple nucleopolyhedrovirus]
MASKRKITEIKDEAVVANVKQQRRDSVEGEEEEEDNQQLDIYNHNNALANIEDNPMEDDEVSHPDHDKMLCVFKVPTITRAMTWVDLLLYNLQAKNITVLRCEAAFNKLFDCLTFLEQGLCIDTHMDEFEPEISKEIIILKPKPPRVVYNVGKVVRGGSKPFFFFDYAKVKRCVGNFGEFLSISWSNQYIHNKAYGKVIIKYKDFDCDSMKLQDGAIVNLPGDDTPSKKTIIVRKFFDVFQHRNERVYMTGRLVKRINCDPFTIERFNKVFEFETDTKSSAEVDMLVGIQIDGFKQSKEEVEFETVNNKKVQERTYSLAIRPMIFIKIEEI